MRSSEYPGPSKYLREQHQLKGHKVFMTGSTRQFLQALLTKYFEHKLTCMSIFHPIYLSRFCVVPGGLNGMILLICFLHKELSITNYNSVNSWANHHSCQWCCIPYSMCNLRPISAWNAFVKSRRILAMNTFRICVMFPVALSKIITLLSIQQRPGHVLLA